MKLSAEEKRVLAELVAPYPVLYADNHPNCENMILIQQLYDEVAEEFFKRTQREPSEESVISLRVAWRRICDEYHRFSYLQKPRPTDEFDLFQHCSFIGAYYEEVGEWFSTTPKPPKSDRSKYVDRRTCCICDMVDDRTLFVKLSSVAERRHAVLTYLGKTKEEILNYERLQKESKHTLLLCKSHVPESVRKQQSSSSSSNAKEKVAKKVVRRDWLKPLKRKECERSEEEEGMKASGELERMMMMADRYEEEGGDDGEDENIWKRQKLITGSEKEKRIVPFGSEMSEWLDEEPVLESEEWSPMIYAPEQPLSVNEDVNRMTEKDDTSEKPVAKPKFSASYLDILKDITEAQEICNKNTLREDSPPVDVVFPSETASDFFKNMPLELPELDPLEMPELGGFSSETPNFYDFGFGTQNMYKFEPVIHSGYTYATPQLDQRFLYDLEVSRRCQSVVDFGNYRLPMCPYVIPKSAEMGLDRTVANKKDLESSRSSTNSLNSDPNCSPQKKKKPYSLTLRCCVCYASAQHTNFVRLSSVEKKRSMWLTTLGLPPDEILNVENRQAHSNSPLFLCKRHFPPEAFVEGRLTNSAVPIKDALKFCRRQEIPKGKVKRGRPRKVTNDCY